jgi:hypothetical protein
MSDIPQPTPARLGQPGLYVLPEAVGFAGTVLAGGRLPARLHFALADDTELHLPISDFARERLCSALEGLKGLGTGHIPGRRIVDYRLSEAPSVAAEGHQLVVEATADDGTTLRLAMSRGALEELRASIDDSLAR